MPTLMLVRKPGFGDLRRPGSDIEQMLAVTLDIVALAFFLIRSSPSTRVEHLGRDRHQTGCATQVPSNPAPASRSLSSLTLAKAISLTSGRRGLGMKRRHAADRVRAAFVAGLDQQLACRRA